MVQGIFSLAKAIRNRARSHAANFRDAGRSLGQQPVATLLSIAVIAIALALPAGLDLLVKNGRNLAGNWENARDFSVYLKADEPLSVAQALAVELEVQESIESATVINADDALLDFRAMSGLGDVLDGLGANPLPHSLIIRPQESASPALLEALATRLANRPDVDLVQIDTLWVQRLNAMLDFLRRLVMISGTLLVLAVIIIIGNTIRLDIQNRRDEIEVMKLLGASDSFVRRPFLYVGFWYGLGGGSVAMLLLLAGGSLLAPPAQRLLELYGSAQTLSGIDVTTVLVVLGGGVLAGWGGAWTAVARHLKRIQPG